LKFIVSHPAVSCVIPATSNPVHAADNVEAASEPLPNESIRKKMVEAFKNL
jgi:aryl-alcohol dehydrogenase-like predicted oxidoreductase